MDVWRAESRCALVPAGGIGQAASIATVATPGDDVAGPVCSLEPSELPQYSAILAEQTHVFWRGIAKSDRYG